jgi:hypothetical protein
MSTEYLEVEVTAADIAQGERGSVDRCPLALALLRATCARVVYVGAVNAYVSDLGDHFVPGVWLLPVSATLFVEDFDARSPVQPSTFEFYREIAS